MFTKVFIHRWNEYSRGAKGLSQGLGVRILKSARSALKPDEGTIIINWGTGTPGGILDLAIKAGATVVNTPEAVGNASNKRTFFDMMSKGVDKPRVPPWTTNALEALKWHKAGDEVCARMKLQSHSGEGLLFFSDHKAELDPLLNAKLFTKYVKKMHEFRVHIVDGEIVDVQKKMLRKTDTAGREVDPKKIDFRVRNLANGFIYGGREGEIPKDVEKQALKAFKLTGLVFGAVDVIYNEKEGKAYVLEVNTAPGLVGTTLENYVASFRKYLEGSGQKNTKASLEKGVF